MNHYVYVHIPFCLSKCHYCSFISFAGAQRFESEYFEALKKEIELFFGTNSEEKLKTLYMGGGTPSIVPVENYEQILSALPGFDEGYEFTFEVNPKTVDKNYLLRLKQLGVNRLA
jgi:oxygen-independent coproporphyrinogen-3 oxidase